LHEKNIKNNWLTVVDPGYIVPRSQWDAAAPYTYGREDSPYGEVNSLGPETVPLLHGQIKSLLTELNHNNTAY